MITYQRDGDVVSLMMDKPDFDRLLMALGYVAGFSDRMGDKPHFWDVIRLANDLNRTNPEFTPYELPE